MAQEFFTILTLLGKAKVADAIANGTDINLSEMAVGDGDYTPTEGQTALVNEVHRAAANQVVRDTENTNWIIAELVIPSETGGFSVREVGIFDAAGDLFAIGKYPETYKPTFEAGSAKELVIRIILEISNQADVTLSVDPTVVTATREYVDAQIGGLASATETYVDGQIEEHKTEGSGHDAENIDYNNTESGLEATNVQDAIDEVSAGTGQLALLLNKQLDGVGSGAPSVGGWGNYPFNSHQYNSIEGASPNLPGIYLPPGLYEVTFSFQLYSCDYYSARIYQNGTDYGVICTGQTGSNPDDHIGKKIVTLADAATLVIQVWVTQNPQGAYGYGRPCTQSAGEEVYGSLLIRRLD